MPNRRNFAQSGHADWGCPDLKKGFMYVLGKTCMYGMSGNFSLKLAENSRTRVRNRVARFF
jgi:hypothetical protein